MDDYRSRSMSRPKSYSYNDEGDMQIKRYYGEIEPRKSNYENNPPHIFRSYSISYGPTPQTNMDLVVAGTGRDFDFKKRKSTAKSWSFNDPEFQRKKRVASYKVYTVEGKVKGSFTKSFKWVKDKYSNVVYGWW